MGFDTPIIANTKTNALFFGPSGKGKTTAAGTAKHPDKNNLAILNTEGGGWQSITHQHGYTPMVWNIRNKQDLVEAWTELAAGKYPEIDTLVIDSVTDLSKVIMDDVLATRQRRRSAPDIPSLEDHGEVSNIMGRMLRKFRDLPINVIFVALEKDKIEQGELNGKEFRRVVGTVPNVPGKLADELPALVDVSVYCQTIEVEVSDKYPNGQRYVAQTIPSKGRACKIRGAMLPPIIDLHWSTIAAAFGRSEGLLANETTSTTPTNILVEEDTQNDVDKPLVSKKKESIKK